jgi:hypothetical protein
VRAPRRDSPIVAFAVLVGEGGVFVVTRYVG